jgi:hypothetical protein
MSRNEALKAAVELAVFERFVRLRGLRVLAGSIEKRLPPEPDIRCVIEDDGPVAYELTEACAPEFAAAETRAVRDGVASAWGADVSEETVRKELANHHPVTYPVELIVYAGRTVLPDDVLEPMITPVLANGLGQYRRVWLLGDGLLELVP